MEPVVERFWKDLFIAKRDSTHLCELNLSQSHLVTLSLVFSFGL
jgi:hypothetical protein